MSVKKAQLSEGWSTKGLVDIDYVDKEDKKYHDTDPDLPTDPVEPPPEPPSLKELDMSENMMVDDDDGDDGDDGDKKEVGEGVISIQIDDQEPTEKLFVFELDGIPGADNQDALEPLIMVEEPEDEVEVEDDPWSWTLSQFPAWLMGMLSRIPRHSGKDVVGVERAMSFMDYLKREISRAVRSDIKGELPIDELEKALEKIEGGIERLQERKDRIMESKFPKRKRKKKTGENTNGNMVKEAKSAKFTVVVPLFISSMARTCINSMVSAGKDIEDCFQKILKTFNLTKREEAELVQLLADMGYPLRRPRGHLLDEEIDTASPDNLDWMQQFPG